MEKADFGVIGLGVMGHMLALNIERNGFTVAGFDLDAAKVSTFAEDSGGKRLIACSTLEEFLSGLKSPRRILMMVPAGSPVDSVIGSLSPLLSTGDLLIDGGNSYFSDTERRMRELDARGILFLGLGVSGGEQGALWGPSLMPGGPTQAWELARPVLEAISAKVKGEPCVAYMGSGSAGHYVKMVHNGIEYGDMQLIAEAYDLLHRGVGLSNPELADTFEEWNHGELESYLIEISIKIFRKLDPQTQKPLLDFILDEAQQKGTGKWTSQNALEIGVATPTLTAAVESRNLSALKMERIKAALILTGPEPFLYRERREAILAVRDALYAAKLCSYAQGFALLRQASLDYGYGLNFSEIARIWRGGCIIRARFLDEIRSAFDHDRELTNLLIDPQFADRMNRYQVSLRRVVSMSAESGIPALAFSSALGYYDAYRSDHLPANLTQAQRDSFGAHTYRRIDRDGSFHSDWD